MPAETLAELVNVLLTLAFVTGACGAFFGSWIKEELQAVGHFVVRRLRPPSAAQLQLMARVMRKRAAQLEIQAEKQLQIVRK